MLLFPFLVPPPQLQTNSPAVHDRLQWPHKPRVQIIQTGPFTMMAREFALQIILEDEESIYIPPFRETTTKQCS